VVNSLYECWTLSGVCVMQRTFQKWMCLLGKRQAQFSTDDDGYMSDGEQPYYKSRRGRAQILHL
jgi:hypothetical protein